MSQTQKHSNYEKEWRHPPGSLRTLRAKGIWRTCPLSPQERRHMWARFFVIWAGGAHARCLHAEWRLHFKRGLKEISCAGFESRSLGQSWKTTSPGTALHYPNTRDLYKKKGHAQRAKTFCPLSVAIGKGFVTCPSGLVDRCKCDKASPCGATHGSWRTLP